jgi:membrane protease YdiL (CAAX protease family)
VVRLIAALVPEGEAVPAAGVLAAQFVAYGLWFACLWALIRFRYDKPFWPSLAWVSPRGSLYGYLALGPVLAFSVGIAGAALQTPEIQMPMMDLLRDRLSLILLGVFAVTLGPLCEELAFRGFFLPLLARSLGPVTGIVITSAVFALLHGPQYGGSWRHVFLIALAGAAFGVVRLRSGSTLAATAMHATYNLTFFVAFLAQGDSFPN